MRVRLVNLRGQLKQAGLQLIREHTAPGRLGAAVALGLFIGTLPIYGLHLPICVGLAHGLRLNKATVYLAANISNPFVAPFLITGSLVLGEWIRFGEWRPLDVDRGRDFIDNLGLLTGRVPELFASCLLGSVVLGAALGAMGGPLTWLWATLRRRGGAP